MEPPSGNKPRRIGRPTDLTPELQASIVKTVQDGNTLDDAAALNGISPSALYDWKSRGNRGEEPFAQFSDAITQARAFAKSEAIRNVREGVYLNGQKDWKAEAWYLERMFPDQFGPQAAVHVRLEKELSSTLDKLQKSLDPDVYHQVLTALAAETGSEPAGGDSGG